MATLTNTQISVTYVGLLKTSANTVLTSTAQQITDGDGNNSIMFLSTAGVGIGGSPASGKELDVTGNVQVTGDLIVDNITIDGSTITNASGDLTIVNTADDSDIIFQSDDSSGGVTTYFKLDGSAGFTVVSKKFRFEDNVNLTLGTGDDLVIRHDASNSHIESATGTLNIEANNLRLGSYGTDNYIIATNAGSVELYHNDVKKFETTSTGATVTGNLEVSVSSGGNGIKVISQNNAEGFLIFGDADDNSMGGMAYNNSTNSLDIDCNNAVALSFDSSRDATFAGNVSLADSKKILLGNSSDLQIYHNASHSFIQDQGTGDLRILSSKVEIFNAAASETMAKFTEDSAVELYHNGSKKFETTSTGAKIQSTGTATLTLLDADDSSEVSINHNAGVTTLVYSDLIFDNGGGNNVLQLTNAINALENITLPDSKKIILGTGSDLEIYHDGSNSIIQDAGTGDLRLAGNVVRIRNAADTENMISCVQDGEVSLAHNNSTKLQTTSTGVTITGNVAVGDGSVSSPSITFSGDTDTGIFRTASNAINFGTNGAERMRLTNTGLGIGTTSPTNLLHLFKNATQGSPSSHTPANATLRITDSANTMYLDGNSIIGVGTDNFLMGNTTAADFVLFTNATERMRITSAGLVGIGTTSPAIKLDVNSGVSDSVARFTSTDSNARILIADNDDIMYVGTQSNQFYIGPDDSATGNNLIIDSSGNATFAGDVTLNNELNFTSSSFQISGGTSLGDMRFVAPRFRFYEDSISGTAKLEIDGGNANFAGFVNLADSQKLRLGDGADLTAHHSGTDSFISNSTGHLTIQNSADDKDILFLSDNGSGGTTEYFKLDGSSTNIVFSKDLFLNDSVNLGMGNGGDYAQFHDGTNTYLSNGTGNFYIRNQADDQDIIFQADDGSGGNAEYFRLDGGNTNMVASKTILYNDTVKASFGNSEDLKIKHDGTNSSIENITGDLTIQNGADDKDIVLKTDNGSGLVTDYIRLDGSDVSTKILTQKVILSNLPTSDPNNAGQLYNESGFLRVSAG